MNEFGFDPASRMEDVVFGAQRPAYKSSKVRGKKVQEWISFMKNKGIKRVCCLLAKEQLDFYDVDLLRTYNREFGEDKVCWAPIEDYHLCDESMLVATILPFLEDSDKKQEGVLVHCSGGRGRTGHVLAAWLVYGRGLSTGQALAEVKEMGGNPYEPVEVGNATEDELFQLLDRCSK